MPPPPLLPPPAFGGHRAGPASALTFLALSLASPSGHSDGRLEARDGRATQRQQQDLGPPFPRSPSQPRRHSLASCRRLLTLSGSLTSAGPWRYPRRTGRDGSLALLPSPWSPSCAFQSVRLDPGGSTGPASSLHHGGCWGGTYVLPSSLGPMGPPTSSPAAGCRDSGHWLTPSHVQAPAQPLPAGASARPSARPSTEHGLGRCWAQLSERGRLRGPPAAGLSGQQVGSFATCQQLCSGDGHRLASSQQPQRCVARLDAWASGAS